MHLSCDRGAASSRMLGYVGQRLRACEERGPFDTRIDPFHSCIKLDVDSTTRDEGAQGGGETMSQLRGVQARREQVKLLEGGQLKTWINT